MLFFIFGGNIKGIICKIESKDNYVLVKDSDKLIRCGLRGKFKKDLLMKKDKMFMLDIAIVGDEVEFEMNADGTGVIYRINERKNYISRKAPKFKGASYRGERYEQVIASNVDNLFIINSVNLPKFNNKLLDRIIVVGESAQVNINIIINKMDLNDNDDILFWINMYKNFGYNIFPVSVKTGLGMDEVRKQLNSKVNLFWGHSGVGKSSLLNTMYPSLNFKVGEISDYTNKGKHTTVTSVMKLVEPDTYIIDTPGIREIDPYGITKESLGHYFIEFAPFIQNCRFNTCTHYHEPDCGVIEAVEKEQITPERYHSYINLLETVEDDMFF